MKKLLVLLLILSASFLKAQNYLVKDFKGVISMDGKIVEKKDILPNEASLTFDSDQSYVYALQLSTRSHFFISPKGKSPNRGHEFLIALKDALIPPEKFYASSSRPSVNMSEEFILHSEREVKEYFRGRLLIIDSDRIALDPGLFPQDSQHFFQLLYSIGDLDKTIPLPFDNNQLLFSPQIIQLGNLQFQTGELEKARLVYVDQKKQTEREIGNFSLHFGSSVIIKSQLELLREAYPQISKTQFLYEHAFPFLEEVYGKTNPKKLQEILKEIED